MTTVTHARPAAAAAVPRRNDSIVLLMAPGLDEQRRKSLTDFLQALGLTAHAIEIPPESAEDWRLPLARQLKSAGVAVDLNRLI